MSNKPFSSMNKFNRKEKAKDDARLKQGFDVILRKVEASVEKNDDSAKSIINASKQFTDTISLIADEIAAKTTKALIDQTRDIFASATSGIAQDQYNLIQGQNNALERNTRHINFVYESKRNSHLKMAGTLCIGSFIICVASMVIFGRYIEKNYNQHILKSASFGEAVARAWPKLTKQEQEKILRFGQEPE